MCPSAVFRCCLIGTSYDHSKPFTQKSFYQWYWHGGKHGVYPICMTLEYHGGWYLIHPRCWFLRFIFRDSLEPHKKTSAITNMSLVQPSTGLCRVPLFWILVLGISRTLCLNSPASLLPQFLQCKITSWYFLCCIDPCVWPSSQRPWRLTDLFV